MLSHRRRLAARCVVVATPHSLPTLVLSEYLKRLPTLVNCKLNNVVVTNRMYLGPTNLHIWCVFHSTNSATASRSTTFLLLVSSKFILSRYSCQRDRPRAWHLTWAWLHAFLWHPRFSLIVNSFDTIRHAQYQVEYRPRAVKKEESQSLAADVCETLAGESDTRKTYFLHTFRRCCKHFIW